MKQVGLFIFDLDGTLVNTLEDITASVNFTLHRLGRKPVPLEAVRRYVGDGVGMLLTRALGDRPELLSDALGIYTVHHSRNLAVRSRLYPGVKEVLHHFRDLPMAVVTNKPWAFSGPLLEALGISGYFRMVVGSDAGLPVKPEPHGVLHVLNTLGVSPGRAVMVGDGTTDIRAGKAAGIATCAVTSGYRSEDELRTAGPEYVIHSISELQELFAPAVEGHAPVPRR